MKDIEKKYAALFGIDRERWKIFKDYLISQSVEKNEYLLREGQYVHSLGFLITGALRTFYTDEKGNEISFLLQTDDSFFGDFGSYLLESPSRLNIQAIEPCEIWFIEKEALEGLYLTDIYWMQFGKQMAEKIFLDARQRIEELLYLNPEQRYLHLLAKTPELHKKIPQKYLSSYFGITPQSLSRIRKRISEN